MKNKDITSKASKVAAAAQKPPSMAAFFNGARPLRIMRHNGLSEVINAVAALPDPKEPVNIVVDLGAATGDITKPWFRDFHETLVEQNIVTTLVVPITSKKDTSNNLFDWATSLQNYVDKWVVVLNQIGQPFDPAFPHYVDSNAGIVFRTKLDFAEVILHNRDWATEDLLISNTLSDLTAINLYKDRANPASRERLGDLDSPVTQSIIRSNVRQIQAELTDVSDDLMIAEGKHRMVVVASGIGGVGKSTTARAIIDWYHRLGLSPLLFDGELETR